MFLGLVQSNKKYKTIMPLFCQSLIKIPVHLFFTAVCDMRVTGREHVDQLVKAGHYPVIFAANHVSELDPIVITDAMPFWSKFMPLYYVARGQGSYNKAQFGWKHYIYGGSFFKAFGAYPVVSGTQDYSKSLVNHVNLLKKGKSILIFPEGKWRDGGKERLPAHGGVAYLAEVSGCPVVPVHIQVDGARKLTMRDLFHGDVRLRVVFGAPVIVSELLGNERTDDPERYRRAASRVMERVNQLDG